MVCDGTDFQNPTRRTARSCVSIIRHSSNLYSGSSLAWKTLAHFLCQFRVSRQTWMIKCQLLATYSRNAITTLIINIHQLFSMCSWRCKNCDNSGICHDLRFLVICDVQGRLHIPVGPSAWLCAGIAYCNFLLHRHWLFSAVSGHR